MKAYAFLHRCVKTCCPSDRFHEIIVKGSQIRIFHDSNFRGRTSNLKGRSPVRVRVRLHPSTLGAIDPPPHCNAASWYYYVMLASKFEMHDSYDIILDIQVASPPLAGHADAEARRSVLTALPCATLVTVPTSHYLGYPGCEPQPF